METEYLTTCDLCLGSDIETADPDCNICRCRTCGYVFDNPRPTLEELIRFYSRRTKYDAWLREEKARDSLWKRRLRKIGKVPRPASLLDVGTGTGQFLHHAKAHYARVRGTEVSESAIEIARRKYGLDVVRGEIEHLSFDETFDVITLFHVLEHVPSPRRTIEACSSFLGPGGLLIVAVPNDLRSWKATARRLLRRAGLEGWRHLGRLGLPKIELDGSQGEIHVSHFTPEVLRGLLERCGLSVVENSLDPYYVARGAKGLMHDSYYYLQLLLMSASGRNGYDTIWMAAEKDRSKAGCRRLSRHDPWNADALGDPLTEVDGRC